MELSGKSMVVVGAGATGLAAARFLSTKGASVTINDGRTADALGEVATHAKEVSTATVFGAHPDSLFQAADGVIVSPGVPNLPGLQAAERKGVEVIGEVELASRFLDSTVIGITGTNGKSTVTTLVGDMCTQSGRPTFVGGNLGRPMIEAVDSSASKGDGLVVVELSSFQLERLQDFRAQVGVLLNITDDHLDRYEDFAGYAAAKSNLFINQTPQDHRVLPANDDAVESIVLQGNGQTHRFGEVSGVYCDRETLIDTTSGLRIKTDRIALVGSHNYDNACASMLCARLAGVAPEDIEKALVQYKGLPHRMEMVVEKNGVRYIDDSKATNVGAAVAAIRGLKVSGKVVLIAGGRDKGGSYAPLSSELQRVGGKAVVLGEAGSLVADAFSAAGVEVFRVGSMPEAVIAADRIAENGDVVLLSPACSSFDMFRSYAERGEVFQRSVRDLGGRS